MKNLIEYSKKILSVKTEAERIILLQDLQQLTQNDTFVITVKDAIKELYGTESIQIALFGKNKEYAHSRITTRIAQRYCASKAKQELSEQQYYPFTQMGKSGRTAMYPRAWLYEKLAELKNLHTPKFMKELIKLLDELDEDED